MFEISAIVLAGGESRRLDTDKAFLRVGDRFLIELVLEKVSQLSGEVMVITNSPQRYRRLGVKLVSDIYPGRGSLGGIYSGLRAASHSHSLIVACDMPFLNLDLLRHMALLAPGYDVVIPHLPGDDSIEVRLDIADRDVTAKEIHLHPLHAIYAKGCIQHIEMLLKGDDLRIISFFPKVQVRYVKREEIDLFDPAHLSFFNINTQADLKRALQIKQRLDKTALQWQLKIHNPPPVGK